MINLIVIMFAVLLAAPIGAAFASQGQEQLVHEQFGAGSWATWFQAEKGWDHGTPGDGKTYVTDPHPYQIPAEKLKNCKLTRIEVSTGYSFDPDTFEKAGGWQRIAEYQEYAEEILAYAPDSLAVTDTHDLATGKVDVTWSLKLNPTRMENRREARVTVDPSVRQKLRELGFNLEDDKTYGAAEQGWLWCLPVHIQWYGIPQDPVNCVASEINSGVSGEAQPGEQYTGTVSFKYFGPEPVQNVPVGAFNGQYQAVLKDAAGNVVTSADYAPDEKKTFNFTWTAPPSGSTTLTGAINVTPLPDLFSETTKADNKVSVTVHVEEEAPPPVAGWANLRALSQDKTTWRTPGTAKWTDTVHVELQGSTPPVPKKGCHQGGILNWRITSARVIVPQKHPNFTFGNPVEPAGTRTVSLSPNGHKATGSFVQDWSVAGAKIFNPLAGKMMAEHPKQYPITIEYDIAFEYRYYTRYSCGDPDCDKHHHRAQTGTGTWSDSKTYQLTVDGTGVNVRAQGVPG